jgi:phenylacetate-CoA ligase
MGYTRNDVKTWSSLMARGLVAGGVTKDDVVQITFHYGLLPGALGVHAGAERLGALVIPVSSGNTKRQIKLMQEYKTTALVSTPSYALHLADALAEAGVGPGKLSLRRAMLGGEPWTEAMRRQIEERLHVTATDNYGPSAAMGPGVAGECLERGGLHLAEDHFVAEVVDPATLQPVPPGQVGELVLTTLTKEAFPLVRYRTRDLTRLLVDPCPCGRTSVRIARISGRSDDMLIVRGVNVYPWQVEAVLRAVLGGEPRWELHLDRPRALDQATLLVQMSEQAFSDSMRRQVEFRDDLRRRLSSELGVGMEVKLVDRAGGELEKGTVRDLRPR